MDMNATDDSFYSSGMTTAVQNGQVSTKLLNKMVFRILAAVAAISLRQGRSRTS